MLSVIANVLFNVEEKLDFFGASGYTHTEGALYRAEGSSYV
jgi:hypothetical protein